jgi:hypothetical protein
MVGLSMGSASNDGEFSNVSHEYAADTPLHIQFLSRNMTNRSRFDYNDAVLLAV